VLNNGSSNTCDSFLICKDSLQAIYRSRLTARPINWHIALKAMFYVLNINMTVSLNNYTRHLSKYVQLPNTLYRIIWTLLGFEFPCHSPHTNSLLYSHQSSTSVLNLVLHWKQTETKSFLNETRWLGATETAVACMFTYIDDTSSQKSKNNYEKWCHIV